MARLMRITGTVLMVAGFTLLEFVGYELFGTSLRANATQSALEADIAGDLAPARQLREPAIEEKPPVTVLPPARADGTIAWARIHIPKIGITKVLVEGATRSALTKGPGHYAGTPLPGTPGAVAIAGHRTTWGAPFHNVDKLRRGDVIVVQSAAGRYRYQVTRSVVVTPRDTEVLFGDPDSDAEHQLVLTTCEPKYSAAKRLIVFADLASWQVAA